MAREKAAYLARLAARTERFDEMAQHLVEMSRSPEELSAEDGYLMSLAYDHAVSTRRTALRRLATATKCEDDDSGPGCIAGFAAEYAANVKNELQRILNVAKTWLSKNLDSHAMTDEARVFYHKMKADNCRDIAEFCGAADQPNRAAICNVQEAYKNASALAESVLSATHPICHCLALNHAVFQSAVVNDPESACNIAPESAPGSLENCRSVNPVLASRRLSSLLLEFPDAAVAGVPWSTLTAAYLQTYHETLDIDALGYPSPGAAADSLLLGVCKPCRNQGIDEGKFMDPLVALVDRVALTPLPGYLGTWPSLYKALCAMVRHFGDEGVPPIDGTIDRPGQSLVLSKVRPLLEKLAGGESNAIVPECWRSWLLSQLKPISHAKQEHQSSGQGMTFRDEEGKSRKLGKIGHLVQAVLRWRHQRLTHSAGTALRSPDTSDIDKALEPNLELAFSKKCNNLVLFSTQGNSCAERCPEYYRDFRSEMNAFVQPTVSEHSGCCAALQPNICIRRSNSTPPLHCMLPIPCLAPRRSVEAVHNELVPGDIGEKQQLIPSESSAEPADTLQDSHGASQKKHEIKDGGVRMASWSSQDRSRSRCRFRAVSREGRARSLTRDQPLDFHSGSAAKRSTSEPPHFCDDPFEPPTWEPWAFVKDPKQPPSLHPASSSHFANLPPAMLLPIPMPQALPPQAPPGLEPQKGAQMPAFTSRDRGRSQCRFGAVSQEGRARSFTREPCLDSHSSAAALRSTSEPPHFCDDPFEPPVQELWAFAKDPKPSPSCYPGSFSCFANLPPNILVAMPMQQGLPSEAPPGLDPFRTHSRGRSQNRFTAGSREGRARSLTREHPLDPHSSIAAANRSTSEPPHFWDDPFEPPIQEIWTCAAEMKPKAVPPTSPLGLAGVHMRSRGRTRGASQEGRAKSLSRDLDACKSFGQLGTNTANRSNSEPPCGFDDPFEPPPQELWASASKATSCTLNLDKLISHPSLPSAAPSEPLFLQTAVPVNSQVFTFHSTCTPQQLAPAVCFGMMPCPPFLQPLECTRPWSRARSLTRADARLGTATSCKDSTGYVCNRSVSR